MWVFELLLCVCVCGGGRRLEYKRFDRVGI